MSAWRTTAAVLAVGLALAGCGTQQQTEGQPGEHGTAATPTAQRSGTVSGDGSAAQELAADPGTRYTKVVVPTTMEGQVCDEGDGGFHFGSDLDMSVTGDDGLKEIESDGGDIADEISCSGSPQIILRKGTRSAAAPTFTARTKLYEKIQDPKASLDRIFGHSMHLEEGYGRNLVGKPQLVTTRTMVIKCQQNVTDTFPMTTCLWANYGAAGVLDFFPFDGQYIPVASASRLTQDFVTRALGLPAGS
ncbi:hypothetical protein [Streptomyces sp. NPDC004788]